MKKLFNSLIFSFIFVVAISAFVPLTTQAQWTDQTVSNLWDVVVRFCNENWQWEPWQMKDLFFEADTWEGYDLCMYVNNNWPTDVDVILNFVDGTITADDWQNKACQPEGTKTNFWQHVDYISEVITVKAWTTTETHWEVTFPEWFSWMSYWCVTMQFAPEEWEEKTESMFNVLSRRWYFIDVLVWWEINVWLEVNDQNDLPFENLTTSKKVGIFKEDTWLYKARISVTNPWNIAQEVTIVPTLQWLFTEPMSWKNLIEKTIVNDTIVTQYLMDRWTNPAAVPITKKVLPNQTIPFEFELNEAIPLWKWPISVSTEIKNKPVFEFVAAEVWEDLMKEKTQMIETSFFVMPWLVVCMLIWLLLLWVVATWKKEEEVVIEKKTVIPAKKTITSATTKVAKTTRRKPAAKKTTTKKTPAKKTTTKKTPAKKTTTKKTTTRKTTPKKSSK